MNTKFAAALLSCAMLTACQYKAEPLTVATYNVYSSYEGKLPGKYLLFVDGSKLDKPIKPSDMNCAAHTFPLNLLIQLFWLGKTDLCKPGDRIGACSSACRPR